MALNRHANVFFMCHSPGKGSNGCKEARSGGHVRWGSAAPTEQSSVESSSTQTRSIVYGGVGFLGKK